MRATTTFLFIAGLIGTAMASADTIYYSDDTCNTEIDRQGFSGFDTGDKAVPEGTKGIRVTRFTDVWYAYQDNDGNKCKGDLITKLDENDGEEGCYKVEELGIGCTRLCDGNPGMGGDPCAVTTA